MLGAEGGGEMGREGVEAGGELLYPLLQGQHLALQVLAAVVELRHKLIHDALHLREERRGEERRGEERRGEERRGEERRVGDDSVHTEYFEEGKQIANT